MQLKALGNLKGTISTIDDLLNQFGKINDTNYKDAVKFLTNGLKDCSVESVKLAIAQGNLSKVQAKAILTAKGLEGAELKTALSTTTMDAANKKATLSTSSLKAAMAGLNATLAANPLFAVGILIASVLAGTKIIEGLTTLLLKKFTK